MLFGLRKASYLNPPKHLSSLPSLLKELDRQSANVIPGSILMENLIGKIDFVLSL